MAAMRVPLWLKIGWTVWVIAWLPFYWTQYGLQNFLFFCDLGNLFLMLALWLESPLIFSWQATGLLLFQSLYAIDLAGALSTGSHIVGGTEYMFDPNVPLFIRLLSLFHVATPPLLLRAIWRLGYDPPRMALPDADRLGGGSRQLFLASAVRRELGPGPLLPRATRDARPALPAGVSSRGPPGRVLSHPPAAAMVGTTSRLPAGGRERGLSMTFEPV